MGQSNKSKHKTCGLGARDVLRLEACFPLYGNELNDTTSPLDSGLKWTVKEEKIIFVKMRFLIKIDKKKTNQVLS